MHTVSICSSGNGEYGNGENTSILVTITKNPYEGVPTGIR